VPELTAEDRARIAATAATLRYAAPLIFDHDEDMANGLYEVAKSLERDDVDPDDWWCCPVCEGVTCDEGCPLEPIRPRWETR
jgi:hypothetical protein